MAPKPPERVPARPGSGPASPTLLARLLEVSKLADEAERDLEKARRAYDEKRSAENLEGLQAKSRSALAREIEFDVLWHVAIEHGFNETSSSSDP